MCISEELHANKCFKYEHAHILVTTVTFDAHPYLPNEPNKMNRERLLLLPADRPV